MITLAESGLSSGVYSALKTQKVDQNFKVVASRYNLDFGDSVFYDSPNTTDNDHPDFDAIVIDNYIFRVMGTGIMESLLIDTNVWSTVSAFVAPSGVNANCPYALAKNASTLYVYASTATGIQQCTSSDYGATFSAWSVVYSFSTATNFYTPNRCVGGVVLASSTDISFGATLHQASNAFDSVLLTGWEAVAAVTSATLQYDFNNTDTPAPIITHYALYSSNFKTWTFQGSANASSWTTIQTVTNDTGTQTGWREYTPTNTTAYRYYRLNVTAVNGAASCFCNEAIMQESTTEQSIMWVSAPSWDHVHFIFCDSSNRLYNPRVIKYSGSWAMTSSDIWLTKKPNSMDATTNGTVDWIVMDTEVPGRVVEVGDKTVGIKNQIYSMGGLIGFEYKNNQWSDHIEIDVIDTLSAFKFRKNIKCNFINGKMYLIAFTSSGTEAYPFTGYRIYTTKDGRNFSNGKLLSPNVLTGNGGCMLLAYGDYVYAVEREKVWRSYSTLYTGTIAADIQMDITAYVDNYSTNHDGMYQYNMVLDNSTGIFDAHAFLNGQNVLIFQHYVGGTVSGVAYTYLTATTRVDTFELSSKIGDDSVEYIVNVSGRDFLSYISDYVAAEESVEKDSTMLGLDTFSDKTGTEYGGLSHLATENGEIDTSSALNAVVMNSTDNLDRSNTMGFSTLSDGLWNGIVDTYFYFSGYSAPFVADAGIVFHAKDSTNFMSCRYHRQTDTLNLVISKAQQSAISASSIGWTSRSLASPCYIRVWTYYGKIRCYTSTDGITWTLKITAFEDVRYCPASGAPYTRDVGDFAIIERGFAGIVADIPHTGA